MYISLETDNRIVFCLDWELTNKMANFHSNVGLKRNDDHHNPPYVNPSLLEHSIVPNIKESCSMSVKLAVKLWFF